MYTVFLKGTITTEGSIGALQPDQIQSWSVTETVQVCPGFSPGCSLSSIGTFGSDSRGTLSWTPSSLTATATDLVFDFGINLFANSLTFEGSSPLATTTC